MALGVWAFSAALLGAALACGQPANPTPGSAPIVQPGAPGESGKTLSPATAVAAPRALLEADIGFMQGMIHHHAQAVEMTDLMRARTRNKKLLALGQRISISQTDEIKYMEQWLTERGQATSLAMDHSKMDHSKMDHSKMDHSKMAGHDMKAMNAMPLMPGMLTPQQMQALAKASGAGFDRLFLTGMIQHHIGALVMVEDLFDTPGAGQDDVLYDFATDIDNTQRAEINIMQGMLKEKK